MLLAFIFIRFLAFKVYVFLLPDVCSNTVRHWLHWFSIHLHSTYIHTFQSYLLKLWVQNFENRINYSDNEIRKLILSIFLCVFEILPVRKTGFEPNKISLCVMGIMQLESGVKVPQIDSAVSMWKQNKQTSMHTFIFRKLIGKCAYTNKGSL